MVQPTKTNKKVLIVDDDPYILKMYQLKLGFEDYEIETAENGKIALEKIKNFKPDVVLLDILMPEMDGFGVLEEMKKESDHKKTKVIVLTNFGEAENLEKAKSFGVGDFIVKTQLTPTQVVERVKKILSKV
ncbi:MAG: response regulator [Candidatus Aenigmarchaeota archaeon]|nr:response regulator [Candidatus Aenigmarchaeota archaeon]